ncbi:MAG: S9 family peptidase [Armatimonadetes bacterium]|nr:S9 family peptidase [Armatimonadota bacterium]
MLNYLQERSLRHRAAALLVVVVSGALALGQAPPSRAEMEARYKAADALQGQTRGKVTGLSVTPGWVAGGKKFWYAWDQPAGTFHLVDTATGSKSALFDSKKLAMALTKAGGTESLDGLSVAAVTDEGMDFRVQGKGWHLTFAGYSVAEKTLPSRRAPGREPWNQNLWPASRAVVTSPDGNWSATIEGLDVVLTPKGGTKKVVATGTAADYYMRLQWALDSGALVATRCQPGDRKSYTYMQQAPAGGGMPEVHNRIYDRPGDKIDTFTFETVDPATGVAKPTQVPKIDYGDPSIRWSSDKRSFLVDMVARGFGSFSLYRADSRTGAATRIIFDNPKTFFDTTQQFLAYLKDESMVWLSERDGYAHLYHIGADGTVLAQLTKGEWVVRQVVKVDEEHNRVVFTASGVHKGEDPYYTHYFAVGLDGKGMVEITPESGAHDGELSPDGEYLVDTYSTVAQAPRHNLRRVADGKLVAKLGEADDSTLRKSGWRYPEPFVAKGRDGKTDIYGVVFRPKNYDPSKKYPVIEDIYAGPQDSFVPKTYRPYFRNQALAELGFVVVQIDGMGTRNRGKAFHDVCFKNIGDAGLPDRILWIKALAAQDKGVDANRVGIFGTSAGGQNSTGAVLFHPEFYKVAVSSCGCHDNRLDKLWWNEQWMSYPVGPEYSASSNIENAAKLKGNLMLIVGEADNNVPPESTYRLAAALQKAGKDYELVVIPNADHTDGGPYGDHKRKDFFVRHLLGVEPPVWNG